MAFHACDPDERAQQWEFPGSVHSSHPMTSTWGSGLAWGLAPFSWESVQQAWARRRGSVKGPRVSLRPPVCSGKTQGCFGNKGSGSSTSSAAYVLCHLE